MGMGCGAESRVVGGGRGTMGCVTAEDRIVMCRERLADRAGARFRGEETLHALRDLIQVVHP